MAATRTRIFLADDHAILREGLRHIISSVPEYEVVGEAGDGKEALEMIEKLRPDVAVLDISMPLMTGIEVSRQVRKYWPEMKIIILSRHDNEEYIEQLIKYGVHAYILKDSAGADLLKAIAEVLRGNVFLSPAIMTKIVSGIAPGKSVRADDTLFGTLTEREIQVLKLIAEGKSTGEIAGLLRISDKTVKVHRTNIMAKLGAHKVADLVRYAVRQGLIDT
ncbi:MAG TPA: response regulator transcription factor [Spirochaetota bacterium]|nr:response regulator transcription factor [Spirochaetota bacterium]